MSDCPGKTGLWRIDMSTTPRKGGTSSDVSLSYQQIRNLTSPEEKTNGLQTYFANLPAFELVNINTSRNLRSYIAEYNPRKRNGVHKAIRNTMDTVVDRFINRNSGITITCSEIAVDDNKRIVHLKNASLINGAQTQGEVNSYLNDLTDPENGNEPLESPFHVRAEIIVDPDESSVTETAIARNTSTPVKSVSQAGKRGQLDDLRVSIRKKFPKAEIRMSETDGPDVLETEQILQQCRLLMPSEVSGSSSAAESLRAYKNRAQCLSDFTEWFISKDAGDNDAERYQFTVDIAPHAIKEYEYWSKHPHWNKMNIYGRTMKGGRALRRDRKTKIITWISPGLLYPIIGAMNEFVVKAQSGWTIIKPDLFNPEEMIFRAVEQFRAHDSDPMAMGRSAAAYDALRIYPRTLMQVIRLQAEAAA